jgi:dimethylargininase
VVIGLSARTNRTGAESLVEALAELGLRGVIAETPRGVLHFKTGCSLINAETVLTVPAMAECPEFEGMRILQTPVGEEGAANLLCVRGTVLLGSHFPQTRDLVDALGVPTITLPVSEIAKIDAGLSCMSLRWSASS